MVDRQKIEQRAGSRISELKCALMYLVPVVRSDEFVLGKHLMQDVIDIIGNMSANMKVDR